MPREVFLDEAPWRVRSDLVPTYWTTDSADPAHVYHDILIAMDEARCLDNGLPSLWAYLFDLLAIQEGEHIVHVGCGTGYYSSILADAVGPSGRITAIEDDSGLAGRAAYNLRDRPTIDVVHGDGCQHDAGVAQVIIVNARASSLTPLWLDSMELNGRLLLPLTVENRRGPLLLITRLAHGYDVRTLRGIEIFPLPWSKESRDGSPSPGCSRKSRDIQYQIPQTRPSPAR